MTLVPRIEIQPCNHCTLKCDGCQHGSPLRPRRSFLAEQFTPLLRQLATFCQWESLIIGGGEPFLHPDLAGFIAGVQFVRPVHVITNGFWMLRPDWLDLGVRVARICSALVVSRYPVYVDRLGIDEWDRRLAELTHLTGCPVSTFHPRDPAQLTFDFHVHHDAPRPITRACTMRTCLQLLPDGRLARCPLGRWHRTLAGKAPQFVAAYERSGFYHLSRGGEGFREWATPDSFETCGYCGLATGATETRKWSAHRACDACLQ